MPQFIDPHHPDDEKGCRMTRMSSLAVFGSVILVFFISHIERDG